MYPDCGYAHNYETLQYCSSCGYDKEKKINEQDKAEGIYPDVVTEFDVAEAEEDMNQAITNYSNLCYLLGLQRAKEELLATGDMKEVEESLDRLQDAMSSLANKLGLV